MSTTYDPWPIRWACETQEADAALVELARRGAQEWLDLLSGQMFGTGTATERYRPALSSSCLPVPVFHGTHWTESGGGGACCRLQLSQLPIRRIIEVRERGAVLPSDVYDVEAGTWLVRRGACWPSGDGCAEPPVEVTYRFGRNVPALGEMAMGQFACELLNAFHGRPCKLPTQVLTSVSRQGVTATKQLSASGKAEMADNLPLVKAFLDSVNPRRLPRPSRIVAPWSGARA